MVEHPAASKAICQLFHRLVTLIRIEHRKVIGRIGMHIGRGMALCALVLSGLSTHVTAQAAAPKDADVQNSQVWITISCGKGCLWKYGTASGSSVYPFAPPTFEIDQKQIAAEVPHFVAAGGPVKLSNGVTEYAFEGALAKDPHLTLRVQFQVNDATSVIRFRYLLKGDAHHTLTAPAGENRLTYLKTSLKQLPDTEEVSLSKFVELTHSYKLSEEKIEDRYFEDGDAFMGPILAAGDGSHSFLLAYEHGSQDPDAFLHYRLGPDRSVSLTAVKGNYFPSQPIDANHSYQTIWMETAAVEGGMDQLAAAYRRFLL
jgi:alpha-galactosidase